jgi:hypothetical protein
MELWQGLSRVLVITGLILLGSGLVVGILGKHGFPLFRLPGDILVQRKNFTFYFPLGTSLLLSLALSFLLWLWARR